MYRAKITAIDGLNVFSGGKRLKIIGNKNFKVGDNVWTDGRCVYGNQRETSSPIVITSPPQKSEIFIPIVVSRNSIGTIAYTYEIQKNSLQPVKEGRLSGYIFANDDKNIFRIRTLQYSDDNTRIFRYPALNVDSVGNIYTIAAEYIEQTDFTYWGQEYSIGNYYDVKILKNGATVKNFNTFSEWSAATSRLVEHSDRVHHNLLAAFIENENNFWILISEDSTIYFSKNDLRGIILINQNGARLLATKFFDVGGLENLLLPMHDGFYRKLANVFQDENYLAQPSGDMKIFYGENLVATINCGLSSTVAAYKISSKKFLAGTNSDGLYLCKNGNVKKILSGRIENQSLRPIKNQKIWYERAVNL